MEQIDSPYRERYVERLTLSADISSSSVERAFRKVPLHKLVDQLYIVDVQGVFHKISFDPGDPGHKRLEIIYSGEPLVTVARNGTSPQLTLSARLLACMLERLELEYRVNVLEMGTGIGYTAALLAELLGDQQLVSTVDLSRENVVRVRRLLPEIGYGDIDVQALDGFYGHPIAAPFDRILVTVGCPDLSPHWINQLKLGGILIAPLHYGGWFPLVRVWQQDGSIRGCIVGSAGSAIHRVEGVLQDHDPGRNIVKEMDESIKVLPLWSGMKDEERILDFAFYLTIQSSQAHVLHITKEGHVVARGSGICTAEKGWAIVAPRPGCLLGHSEMLLELSNIYREWEGIGMPAMADYQIEFMPLDSVPNVPPLGTWILDRKFFRQRLWMDTSKDNAN